MANGRAISELPLVVASPTPERSVGLDAAGRVGSRLDMLPGLVCADAKVIRYWGRVGCADAELPLAVRSQHQREPSN